MNAFWFIIGLLLGMSFMWWFTANLLRESMDHTRRWHRRAIEYMELWLKDKHRPPEDSADWWKHEA